MNVIVLETVRTRLRHIKSTDAEFIFNLYNDKQFVKNIGYRGINSFQKAEEYIIENIQGSYKTNGFGIYGVEMKDSGKLAGICGLVNRPHLDDIDLGYAFMPKYRGKGLALETAKSMKEYAINVLEIEKIVAIVDPNNEPSINLLKKIGMSFEKMILLPGDTKEICLYS
ncbi:MAG: GNAT family N-acetyltransferase [Rhodothermaceae bacterium]